MPINIHNYFFCHSGRETTSNPKFTTRIVFAIACVENRITIPVKTEITNRRKKCLLRFKLEYETYFSLSNNLTEFETMRGE